MIGKTKLTRSRQGVTRSQALIGDNQKFRGFHSVPNITNQTMDQQEPMPRNCNQCSSLIYKSKPAQPCLDLLSHQTGKENFYIDLEYLKKGLTPSQAGLLFPASIKIRGTQKNTHTQPFLKPSQICRDTFQKKSTPALGKPPVIQFF